MDVGYVAKSRFTSFILICVQRLATSAYKPPHLGKSLLFGLYRRAGQPYPLVADRVASHPCNKKD